MGLRALVVLAMVGLSGSFVLGPNGRCPTPSVWAGLGTLGVGPPADCLSLSLRRSWRVGGGGASSSSSSRRYMLTVSQSEVAQSVIPILCGRWVLEVRDEGKAPLPRHAA
jgi:hypothetical protein